jgi:putative addiction module CopG family antidote
MNISLPDEMRAFIETEMIQEGYASASEYMRALIREAQKCRAKQEKVLRAVFQSHGCQ